LQSVKVAQELASDAIYIYNNNRLLSALMYKNALRGARFTLS